MFWRRKRNEGFEWRDYVRTTILVRREQRRQRIKDVQAAAAEKVKDAGKRGLDAGLAGARSAGAGLGHGAKSLGSTILHASVSFGRTAAAAIARGTVALGYATANAAGILWSALSALTQRIGEPLAPHLDPLLAWVREPRPNLALKIVALLAGLGAAYRSWTFGFDSDALVAVILGGLAATVLLLAHLGDPRRNRDASERESLLERLRGHEFELPGQKRFSAAQAGLAILGLVAIVTAGSALYHYGSPISLAGLSSPAPVTTGALPENDASRIEGRAVAVSGDTLRIAGKNVLLDGIEAPEPSQSCQRASGSWKCGTAAKDQLATLVRGRRITCDILGEESSAKRARCYAGGEDIAEQLVRSGNVFADGGFWGSYAGVEGQAQERKLGLWAGEAERPQDYREKRWQEAKKTAPEGCPIKGAIRSGTRTYVLPWAASYESTKVRESRGERWFCSESEAEAAGWSRGSQS